MQVHLVDGTYELFRHHFGVPSHLDADGTEVAAARGVLGSVMAMLEQGATHVGVATDHVIESFRNDLWAGYKTSAGMPPELLAQFPLLEDGLDALGVAVWPMVDLEADDAMASAAAVARADPRVERVFICTPDKDLGQCVEDPLVVQVDRRRDTLIDEAGVRERFGVAPHSIPDYLALVGDSADGFPGLPGWGAKSTATVLARYEHLDAIPDDSRAWDVEVRGATKLASTLATARDAANLFLDLATLRTTAEVGDVDDWEWRGPHTELEGLAERLGAENLVRRATRLAEQRGAR
jgi:5'-3' exonuclease